MSRVRFFEMVPPQFPPVGNHWIYVDPVTKHAFRMDPTGATFDLEAVGTGTAVGLLQFGAGSVGSSTTTRFLYPGDTQGVALTSELFMVLPRGGTLKKLRIIHNTLGAGVNLIVYTVRKNGIDTLLLVSIAANVSLGSDLINTVVFAAGDQLSIKITKAVAIGGSPTEVVAMMELAD